LLMEGRVEHDLLVFHLDGDLIYIIRHPRRRQLREEMPSSDCGPDLFDRLLSVHPAISR
jgi:hypothetical protein